MGFEVRVYGLRRVEAGFRSVRANVRQWRRTGDAFHDWSIEHYKQQFSTLGSHGGRGWADYSGERIFAGIKQRSGVPLVPLRYIGKREVLYPSFIQRSHPYHLYRVGKKIEVGSTVSYARRHQMGIGYNRQGEKIPERRIASMTNRQSAGIGDAYGDYFMSGRTTAIKRGRT